MSEANNPRGTDLNTARNAIKALLTPQEDTVTEEQVALETEATEVEQVEEQVEQPVEEVEMSEDAQAPEDDLEVEAEAEELEDTSLDILGQVVEVDGEEITVEELRRGNLRQRDYTRKTQELAEYRKSVEAQAIEMERERAQYAQMLPALQERLEQKEQEPDWDILYDQDPNMARKAERAWQKQQEERQAQIEAVKAERERMQQVEQERMYNMQLQYQAQQREILPDLIPEWRDTKVASTEAKEVRDFLLGEGFSEQDISGLTNATLVKVARKAMLYDKGQTKATQAKTKPKKQQSRTLRAGSRNTQPKPKSEQTQALQRARQTGRVADAAAAIKTLLQEANMAIITNTFTSFDAKGIREQLSDVISSISPEEVPLQSNVGSVNVSNTYFEWQTDSLNSTDKTARADGDDVGTTYDATTATTRVGNYTHILRRTAIVADNLSDQSLAGRSDEMAMQIAKRGKELRRDFEAVFTDNNQQVAGNTSTPRETAGLGAWIATNDVFGSGGASPTGDGTDARTDGTQAAFTEAMVKSAMQSAYSAGGKPTILMTGPFNKTKVSGFAGIAAQRYMAPSDAPTTIIGAADVYLSDFGSLSCVVNLFQRERDAFLLDPELAEIAVLRPSQTVDLAKTGDATRKMVIGEMGLQVTNEAGHAGVFDLTTS